MRRRNSWNADLQPLRRPALARVPQSRRRLRAESDGQASELVHELEAHQAELEMQNETLRSTQSELQASRDRYAALYDSTPVGCLTLDARGVIVEANLSAAALVGMARRDLVGKRLSRFLTAQSRDAFCLHRQRVFATTCRQTCELQLRRPGGAVWEARLESIALASADTDVLQCWTALSDITERKRVEENLGHLAAIVESSNDAIISRTLEDRIVSWNPASERMLGYSAQEVVGRPFSILVPPERRGELRGVQARILCGERIEHYETARLAKDGRLIDVSATTSAIRDAHGRIIGISSILRDIRRRKAVEALVRRNAKALADFFAQAPVGLLWVAPDGRILRANRAQLALFGRASHELRGQPLGRFYAEPEVVAAMLKQLRQRESLSDRLVRLRRPDGSIRHVLIDANGLWEDGKMVLSRWFARDVTRRVQLQKEILLAGERVQRQLGQELHDGLCQQLTSIEYLCLALERQLAANARPEAGRAKEIAGLTRQANTCARELSHGMCPMELDAEGLAPALRNLAARTTRLFQVACRFRGDGLGASRDGVVQIYLYRIAQEAVTNAVKHGKASRIEIALKAQGRHITLSVQDNGRGIPARLPRDKGCGLRIMDHRASALAGSLVVQRRKQGGTRLVCSIPRALLMPSTPCSL